MVIIKSLPMNCILRNPNDANDIDLNNYHKYYKYFDYL